MAVRLKDIARELGVSVVTVSKVLRNHSDIGAETRARVLRRMEELNYRPNLAARALVTGRTYALGLVVPDLVHPFFAEVAKGLSRVLRKKSYSLVIASSEEDPELERTEIDQLLARRVDALIIASSQEAPDNVRQIEAHRTPYVLIDRRLPDHAANFVGVDDHSVGRLATDHLLDAGCRRIAHIRGPELSTAIGRLAGYRAALAERSISVPEDYVIRGRSADDAGDVSGYEAMKQLLTRTPRPDGVFCFNDPTAMGALGAILDAGLRVPQDIAVIGCGNVRYAALLRVPLSSVDQDSQSIGEQAARLALKIIEGKDAPASRTRTILVKPRIVARESTRRTV